MFGVDNRWMSNGAIKRTERNEILEEKKTCLSAKSYMHWPKIEPGTPKLPEKTYFPKKSQ